MAQAHPSNASRPSRPEGNRPEGNRPEGHRPEGQRPPPHARPLPLRVGTRGSPLALWQTRFFLARLSRFCPVLRDMDVFEEHAIRTTGDATQAANTRLADLGGKGLFAKEIHEALLDRRIDFAVHSLKDLETALPPGIVLACTLVREDARDALVLPQGVTADDPIAALPQGALVGSSSLRRQAQLLHLRPDLRFGTLRGNVARRIERVRNGDFGATLLAIAGMKRLGLEGEAAALLDPAIMLPAACQGIVGITVRADDVELAAMLGGIEDADARAVSGAERALLAALDGSCRTPIGGHAKLLEDGQLHLTGLVARSDGSFLLRRSIVGGRKEAERLGAELGASLRADSPRDIFA